MTFDENAIVASLKALVDVSPSIKGVAVLTPDGLEIAKYYKDAQQELEALDILGVEIQKYSARMVKDYEDDQTEYILIRTTKNTSLIYFINEEAMLSIQATPLLNLNWAIQNVPKLVGSLKRFFNNE